MIVIELIFPEKIEHLAKPLFGPQMKPVIGNQASNEAVFDCNKFQCIRIHVFCLSFTTLKHPPITTVMGLLRTHKNNL